MTPALRWVAMRTILMFHLLWGTNFTKSQDSVHRPQLLKRKESQSGFELRSLCLPAWRLSAGPNRLMLPLPQEQCSSVLPVCAMFQHLQYTEKLYLIRNRNINGYFILVLSVFSTFYHSLLALLTMMGVLLGVCFNIKITMAFPYLFLLQDKWGHWLNSDCTKVKANDIIAQSFALRRET